MRYKSKFIRFFALIVIGILVVNVSLDLFVLRNASNSKIEEVTSPKSSATFTITDTTPYGGFAASGNICDENNYLEWSISTLYGPGFSFYMMNNTELFAYLALPGPSRTPGNFAYTALLSDEEASASGTFYPAYSDTWWFVVTNHYSGTASSADFFDDWYDNFITVDEPTNSRAWEEDTSHYVNWTWEGDFAQVDIDLYHDGVFLRNIATNAQNNGSYLWRLPDDISLFDDLYQVNISNTDFSDTWGISDSYFEITEKPSINVVRPSSSNSWKIETTHFINWTSTAGITNVKIELFKDDIFELEEISSTPNDGYYSWTIPSGLDGSDRYQIKIADASDPSIYDFSEYFEIFNFTISITNPNSESVWETDTPEYINWTSTGIISNLMMELYNNDAFVMEITPDTPNDGEYNWTIPSGLDGSDQYQIKIIDVSNSLAFNFSEYFEIFSFTITITNPDSESVWETDTSEYINWTSTGSISNVKMELYNNDAFVIEITPDTPNDGEYNWAIPSGLDGSDQYQIKIADASDPSVYNFSEYFEIFSFTISITNPHSSSSWETGVSEYINWTSTGPISSVLIELYNNDAFVMEITPNTPNDDEFNWAIPSGLDSSDQYQIKITDLSDPSVYDFSEYFEIMRSASTEPPEIPGYNLSILIGIISIISVILVKKRILK